MRPAASLLLALAAALGAVACDASAGPPAEAPEPSAEAPAAQRAASVEASAPPAAAAGQEREGEEGALRVVVTASEDAAPLAERRVYVWPRPGTGVRMTEVEASTAELGEVPLTGADGAVTFTLPPGRYGADTEWPPAQGEVVDVAAGGEAEVVLRRPSLAERAFHVRVLDPRGAPVAGAELHALDVPAGVRNAVERARTDADGRASVTVPAWTPLVAAVRAEGLGETRLVLTDAHGTPERARAVRLAAGSALVGRLVDQAGAPVPDAALRARASAAELFAEGEQPDLAAATAEVVWRATTDASGAFALAVPAGVGLVLEVEREGGARAPLRELDVLRLEPGETREHVLVSSAGTRVQGVVVGPDQEPRAGVPVWLVRGGARRVFTRFEEVHDRAVTDAEGAFAFEDVEPGSWRVGPAPRGVANDAEARDAGAPIAGADPDGGADEVAPVPELIEVLAGMPLVEIVLQPPRALFVRGRCLGPDGEPVAGVHVMAGSEAQVATAVSDAEGRFALGPLVEGELALRATAAGSGYAPTAPVRVRAGAADVVVQLARAGRVEGAVTRDGEPAEAVVRVVSRERLRGSGGRQVAAGADGRFALGGLEPGIYVVVARAEPDYVAVAGRVEVGPDAPAAPALALERGARARVALPAGHGARFAVVYAGGDPVERRLIDDAVDLVTQPFPPGEVVIELFGPDGPLLRGEAIAEGGRTVEVMLR